MVCISGRIGIMEITMTSPLISTALAKTITYTQNSFSPVAQSFGKPQLTTIKTKGCVDVHKHALQDNAGILGQIDMDIIVILIAVTLIVVGT